MTLPTPVGTTNLLDDGVVTYAPTGGGVQTGYGQVSSVAKIFDTGSTTVPWNGIFAVNPTTIDFSSTNETYTFVLQGSTSSTFASGNVDLASMNIGAVVQNLIPASNQVSTTIYRYLRLKKVLTGTTPSIKAVVFIQPLTALDTLENYEVLQIQALVAQNQANVTTNISAWSSGTTTGGPSSDGYYPLTNFSGATTLAPSPAKLAEIANAAAMIVTTFTSLGTTSIPTGVDLIRTSGYRTKGIGGAFYVSSTTLPTSARGTLWQQTANGRYFVLVKEQLITPLMFGAYQDGASHTLAGTYASLALAQVAYPFSLSLNEEFDYVAWQTAFNYGGYVFTQPGTYKMCNTAATSFQPLTVVAGKSWTMGSGARLNWSGAQDRNTSTHYVANYNFATASGWTNASVYTPAQITMATFNTGAAVHTDPSTYPSTTASGGHFSQFGYQVSLVPGKYTATCTFETTLGASYASGNPNPPYANISFSATSPGVGSNFSGRSASGSGFAGVFGGGTVTQTIKFYFTVTSNTTSWLTFTGGGYANFRVTELDIRDFATNCGILATRDGSSDHYPIYQPLDGLDLVGPGRTGTALGLSAILWKSFSDVDGNLVSTSNGNVQNWDIGHNYQDGAYLVPHNGINMYNNNKCIYFGGGTANSGENMRYINGGCFNSAVCIDNPGAAEFSFFGTAMDYSTQIVTNNRGKIEFHGLRAEFNASTTSGKPPFHCYGSGSISWYGSYILIAGGINTAPNPPVKLDNASSSFTCYGTTIYNLTSSTGRVVEGPGSFKCYGWKNTGNPNINFISDSIHMDVFAGLGGVEPGTSTVSGEDYSDINIQGGIYPGGTQATQSRWITDNFRADLSTDYFYEGTRSLKFTKTTIGAGTANNEIIIAIPVSKGENVWFEMQWLAPYVAGAGTGTVALYARSFWGQMLYNDPHGRPVWNRRQIYKGEVDIQLPLAGSPTWTKWTSSSGYTEDNSVDGTISFCAPTWATHYLIVLDTQTIPNMSFFLDGLKANVL